MRTALFGTWHVHAEDYLKHALAHGEVTGIYDERPGCAAVLAEKYGLAVFDTPEDLLASDCEGVICCSATNHHAHDMVKIAEAGKHIFTEKVLALTTKDCMAVADAVKKAGVRFVISLPWKYRGAQMAVKAVLESGELGKPNYMRFRNCHDGSTGAWLPAHFYSNEECGGGAMIDLGAHGMYLTDWYFGMPDTYNSTFTLACPGGLNTEGIEDNAVTVMGYADGKIAVNETGFVTRGCPFNLEIGGETGYVWTAGSKVIKRTASTAYADAEVELPGDLPLPIDQFLTGEILPGCGMDEAIHLTQLMEGAYAAAK